MSLLENKPLVIISVLLSLTAIIDACSNGGCKLLEECSSTADCAAGLLCGSCPIRFQGERCIRSTFTDQFKLLRSDGRGAFQAVDKLNGKLLCGCDDVNACVPGSSTTCNP